MKSFYRMLPDSLKSTSISFGFLVAAFMMASSAWAVEEYRGFARGRWLQSGGQNYLVGALKPELIPQLIGNFAPAIRTWELQMDLLKSDGSTTEFQFTAHKIPVIEGEDGARENASGGLTTSLDSGSAPDSATSSTATSSWWGLGGVVSSLASSVTHVAQGLLNTAAQATQLTIAGTATQEQIDCPDAPHQKGVRVTLDLHASSYIVLSATRQVSLDFCTSEKRDEKTQREITEIEATLSFEPGMLISQLDPEEVHHVLDRQTEACLEALVYTAFPDYKQKDLIFDGRGN